MPMFRKKPVVIEAMQFTPHTSRRARELALWIGKDSARICCGSDDCDATWLHILTLEGSMSAQANDWVIRGVKGEFYPCKPDIFEATYDAVDADG